VCQVSRTSLASYLLEMRASSRLVEEQVHQYVQGAGTSGNEGAAGLRLDRYGGVSYKKENGQLVVLNVTSPLYVFDNEVRA
jgi:hypothetical protein